MSTLKLDKIKDPKILAVLVIVSLVLNVAAISGLITPEQNQDYQELINNFGDQIAELQAENAELSANQTALQNQLDQPVGSTLSASRKTASFVVSFSTNLGVPAATLCLQSGVNGSLITLGSNATHYTPIIEKAVVAATAINGSIYVCEGNYLSSVEGVMVFPTIPLGVMVTIDPGAYNYTVGTVEGTLADYHNNVFITAGYSSDMPYWLVSKDSNDAYYVRAPNSTIITAWTSLVSATTQASVYAYVTSGEVRLNGVAFDLALMQSIPTSVSVVENVNGRERTFGNIADTQGSPYTISVEDTQYFAQDSIGTIRITSTNQTLIEQQVVTSLVLTGGTVVMNNLKWTNTVVISSNIMVIEQNNGKYTVFKNPSKGVVTDYPLNAVTHLTLTSYIDVVQHVHPSVVYFENAWNGYTYWMAVTPYPTSNDAYENPCIFASNDGLTWVVPDGLTNPINSTNTATHYADPSLMFDAATNQLWCYFIEGGSPSVIYRSTSSDGVTWSEQQNVLSGVKNSVLSPSIIKDGSAYSMWCVNSNDNQIYKYTSTNGITWTLLSKCSMNGITPAKLTPWHLSVNYDSTSGKYWTLYSARLSTNLATEIRMATSTNGLTWNIDPKPFLTRPSFGWSNSSVYQATSVLQGETLKIWYSAVKDNAIWHVGYTTAKVNFVNNDIYPLYTAYTFDEETTSTIARNNILNDDFLQIGNSTFTTNGKINNAITFTNTGDRIISNKTVQANTILISCDVKLNGIQTDYAGIITQAGKTATYEYALTMGQTNYVRFGVNTGGTTTYVTSNSYLPQGIWVNLQAEYNSTHIMIYFNGQLACTPVTVTGNIIHDYNPFYIGGSAAASSLQFKGSIDEVKIYTSRPTAYDYSLIETYLESLGSPNRLAQP